MSLLVVIGATGHQGGAVINHFLAQHERLRYKLRGTTRNVDSSSARELQSKGVEMVTVNLADKDSLQRAFSEATHIFANTDSNQMIYKAVKDPSLTRPGQTAADYGVEEEMRFAKNIIEAAAATESLQRIIWSSLPSPKKRSNGKYTKVVMFDTKDTITGLFQSNPRLQNKYSVLINAFYLDNPIRVPELYAPKQIPITSSSSGGGDGVYELSFPMSGDSPVPVTDITADEGLFVEALFSAPPGTFLLGYTETTTWKSWLSSWGNHLDVSVRYVRADPDKFASHMPGLNQAISEEFQYVGEFGFAGDDEEGVTLEQLNPELAKRLSSVDKHLKRTDWSSIV